MDGSRTARKYGWFRRTNGPCRHEMDECCCGHDEQRHCLWWLPTVRHHQQMFQRRVDGLGSVQRRFGPDDANVQIERGPRIEQQQLAHCGGGRHHCGLRRCLVRVRRLCGDCRQPKMRGTSAQHSIGFFDGQRFHRIGFLVIAHHRQRRCRSSNWWG